MIAQADAVRRNPGRGRPRRGEILPPPPLKHMITVRIAPEEFAEIAKAAKAAGMSQNAWCVARLNAAAAAQIAAAEAAARAIAGEQEGRIEGCTPVGSVL